MGKEHLVRYADLNTRDSDHGDVVASESTGNKLSDAAHTIAAQQPTPGVKSRDPSRPIVWAGYSNCGVCSVRQSALFKHLSDDDFRSIHFPIDAVHLRPGAVLFNSGERADYLFTVRSGALKIETAGRDGSAHITAMIVAGGLVGLPAYVLGKYDSRAVALTQTNVCRLPISTLRDLERQSPRFIQNMQEKWVLALSSANAWLTDMSQASVRVRLARLLLKFPTSADGITELCSHRDIGDMLGGVAIETVSRNLSGLRKQGVITEVEARTRRFLIDRVAMAQIAG